MKLAGLVLVGTAAFLVGIGAIYWFTSYEDAGTTLLVLALGLGFIPGAYLLTRSSRLPQDQPDADPERDGTGVVGLFPERSIWPFTLAAGAAFTGVGLVFGLWAALPGIGLMLVAFVAVCLESRPQR